MSDELGTHQSRTRRGNDERNEHTRDIGRVRAYFDTGESLTDEELVSSLNKERSGHSFTLSVMVSTLVDRQRWSALRLALRLYGANVSFEALKSMCRQHIAVDDTECLFTLKHLLTYCCEDKEADFRLHNCAIGYAVNSVATLGLVEQFQVLVNCEDRTVRWWLVDTALKLVFRTCSYRVNVYTIRSNRLSKDDDDYIQDKCRGWKPGFNACLALAAETGLLHAAAERERLRATAENVMTQTMAGAAVLHNQPDLLEFLMDAEGVSREVLTLLRAHPASTLEGKVAMIKQNYGDTYMSVGPVEGYPGHNDPKVAQAICDKLADVSRVSSLRQLCVLRACQQLGWGPAKKERLGQLTIAEPLKDQLRFKQAAVNLK